jgi:hypothetical protein
MFLLSSVQQAIYPAFIFIFQPGRVRLRWKANTKNHATASNSTSRDGGGDVAVRHPGEDEAFVIAVDPPSINGSCCQGRTIDYTVFILSLEIEIEKH